MTSGNGGNGGIGGAAGLGGSPGGSGGSSGGSGGCCSFLLETAGSPGTGGQGGWSFAVFVYDYDPANDTVIVSGNTLTAGTPGQGRAINGAPGASGETYADFYNSIATPSPTPTSAATPIVTPTPTGSLPTLEVSPMIVKPGEQIIVTYSGTPGGSTDWIAIFPIDAPNESYGQWDYLPNTNGVLTFAAPSLPGIYELRLLPNDGYQDIARSGPFQVAP